MGGGEDSDLRCYCQYMNPGRNLVSQRAWRVTAHRQGGNKSDKVQRNQAREIITKIKT